jgi:hypothetical protein
MPTEIRKCTCNNPYMDNVYGESMRVYNMTSTGYRCASCLHEIKHSDKAKEVKTQKK